MIVAVALSVIFVLIGYLWYERYKLQEKLKWIVEVPGWPIIGSLLEFDSTSATITVFQRLIERYGKIIRLNLPNNMVVVTDYDFIEFVLGTHHILDKTMDYRFLHRWLGTGLLTSEATKWKRRRRMETPAFHFKILEQFVEYFDSNGKILVEQLQKELDKDSFDVYPYITLYALDVICETAMGVSVNAQINKDSEYVTNVKEMLRIMTERTISLLKKYDLTYKLSSDYYKELRVVKQLHSVTYSVIDARKKELENKLKDDNNQERDDLGRKKKMAFLDILLQSTIDGKPLSREDIREEVDTFMFEGHDTTTAAMSFALYLLAKHPDIQERAFQEQREIFDDDMSRSASYNDLQAMKYLESVIKETLRLYPSVPIIGRKANRDIEYKGNIVPKGLEITIFIYGVLRDPDNFKDPETFDPERYESIDGTRPFSFIPFSAGPRNCIGQKFATLEIKCFLSKILRNFELLPSIPEHNIMVVPEAVLKSRNGIKIKLKKRKW